MAAATLTSNSAAFQPMHGTTAKFLALQACMYVTIQMFPSMLQLLPFDCL
jgi:hypothetical protein